MKKLLFFVLMISCSAANAQQRNQINGNNEIGLPDPGGSMLFKQSSMLTAYSYDTVRAIDEINNPTEADAFPWISPNGLRIYYTNGADANNLYHAFRPDTNSLFISLGIVPINISSPTSYWLTHDELEVYICAQGGIYYAWRSNIGSLFGTPVLLNFNIPFSNARSVSMDSTGQQMFFYLFSGPYAGINQYQRVSPTSFNFVRILPILPGFQSSPGQLSKDGLTYFFSSAATGKLAIYQLTRNSLADSFQVSTFAYVLGINDIAMYNIQPSMSDDLSWVALVRSDNFLWDFNDLYLAHRYGSLTSVFSPAFKSKIVVAPNPTSGIFYINGLSENSKIALYDNLGLEQFNKTVTQPGKTKFEISNLANGVYYISITDENGLSENLKVVKN
jgi:hypothetical protein